MSRYINGLMSSAKKEQTLCVGLICADLKIEESSSLTHNTRSTVPDMHSHIHTHHDQFLTYKTHK